MVERESEAVNFSEARIQREAAKYASVLSRPSKDVDRVLGIASRVMGVSSAALGIVTGNTIAWVGVCVRAGAKITRDESWLSGPRHIPLFESVLLDATSQTNHYIEDVRIHPLHNRITCLPWQPSLEFLAAVPALDADSGCPVGALILADGECRSVPPTNEQFEHMRDLAAMAMRTLLLKRETQVEKLSYVTATAHNLKTPMACFDLCIGVMKLAVEQSPLQEQTIAVHEETVSLRDILDSLILASETMGFTINKAITESMAQNSEAECMDELGDESMEIRSTVLARRKETNIKELVERAVKLMRLMPGLCVPLELQELSPGDPGTDATSIPLPPILNTDGQVVLHALIDLLANAVRHTKKGKISVTISARICTQKAIAKIEVCDTGSGFNQDLLDSEKVFKHPFVVGDESAGTYGLGLFAVANGVASIGGTCGIRPNPDGGSCVWFECPDYGSDIPPYCLPEPVAESSLDAVKVLSRSVSDSGVANVSSEVRQSFRSDSILDIAQEHAESCDTEDTEFIRKQAIVIDDSGVVRKLMVKMLVMLGFSVRVGIDGRDGLECMRTGSEPFVFVDFLMPHLTGPECVEAYRILEKTERKGRRYIIGFSANAQKEDIAHALATGMDEYVSKPISIEVLREIINRLLDNWSVTFP